MRAIHNDATAASVKLLEYCRANDWAGYDPYDALNSRLFTAFPFLDSRLPRLLATQALKRSPVNIRRVLLIPRTQNPKAMGLCLAAVLKLRYVDGLNVEGLDELMVVPEDLPG